jgi:hypothetical protein
MKTTPAKCVIELESQLRSLRTLDSLNQRQFAAGLGRKSGLSKAQLHVLTEAIFFAGFRAYEQFMRNVFVLYCCGVQPSRRRLIRPYLKPKTLKHAEELLQSSMPFLDWSSPDSLIDRAETYLEGGYPVKDVITANLESLRDLKRIRNHIAHMSKESQAEYLKTVKRHYGIVPLKVPRPGEFLLLTRRGSRSYYLSDYLQLINKVAAQFG